MTDLVHVTAVEVVGDHRLRLAFEDGAEGEVDLSGWQWRGVFEPLADPSYFCRVSLDGELGTIVWPNGADLAPETLHAWVSGVRSCNRTFGSGREHRRAVHRGGS